MPIISIDLTENLKAILQEQYRNLGFPKGKTKRGLKKWSKAHIIKALTEFVETYGK